MISRKCIRGLFGLTLLCLSMSSCTDKETLPNYFFLKDYKMAGQIDAFSKDQNFEDYWVYTDNSLLGVFPPHSVAPVLNFALGKHEMAIFPGIRANGLRDEAVIYPFIEPYRVSIDLCQCGRMDTIRPEFKYKSSTKYSFVVDFEPTNIFVEDYDKDLTTYMEIVDSTQGEVYEGKGSGRLKINKDHLANSVGTNIYFNDFQDESREIYLELNYKGTAAIEVYLEFQGSFIYTQPVFVSGLYPSSEWKKAYINLAPIVNQAQASDGMRVILSGIYNYNDPNVTQQVYIDNIKLLHF